MAIFSKLRFHTSENVRPTTKTMLLSEGGVRCSYLSCATLHIVSENEEDTTDLEEAREVRIFLMLEQNSIYIFCSILLSLFYKYLWSLKQWTMSHFSYVFVFVSNK